MPVAEATPDTVDELPLLHWTVSDPNIAAPETTLFQPLGTARAPKIPFPIHRTTFLPGTDYRAALTDPLQTDGVCVSFNLTGGAAENPEDGTTLEIGGATIGLKIAHHPGHPSLIDVVAFDAANGSTGEWTRLKLVVFPHHGFQADHTPRLSLRFHAAAHRYDVLINNAVCARGLGLRQSATDAGAIVLHTGTTNQPIVLNSLRIGSAPSGGIVLPVDAEGNRTFGQRPAPGS